MIGDRLDQSLRDLYEAEDLAQLREHLIHHLADLGYWAVGEFINSLRVTETYVDPRKYVWDNLCDHVGRRKSDLIEAIWAACLSVGIEEENRRLRWMAAQTRPYLMVSNEAPKFPASREIYKVLEDFGHRAANTLVVPVPDGGAGRHRLWAYAETAGDLRNAGKAVVLMIAYCHMKQMMQMAERGPGSCLTATGSTAPAEPARDPMNDPVQTPQISRFLARHGQESRAQAVRAYIEDHLDDPDLGVERLCRRFAMSRRTVYRMFADDGGVGRYLVERRLVRAFGALRAASPSRGLINAVALDCGFDDQRRFRRLFRQRFAIAPSDAVGLGLAAHSPAHGGSGSPHGHARQRHATDRTSQARSGL